MGDLVLSLGVALVAELGDKSQLAAVSFGARHRFLPVLLGFAIGATVTQGLAVLFGAAVGELLPETARSLVAGGLFLAFAVWSLRSHDVDEEEVEAVRAHLLVIGVAVAVFLAEIGDKTMFATATLAARQSPIPTWLGASLGMTGASAAALGIGAWLGPRLPERGLRLGGAVMFAVVGLALLWDGMR